LFLYRTRCPRYNARLSRPLWRVFIVQNLFRQGIHHRQPTPAGPDIQVLPQPWSARFEQRVRGPTYERDLIDVRQGRRGRRIEVMDQVDACDGVRGVKGRGEERGNVAQDFERQLGYVRGVCGQSGGTIILVHAIVGGLNAILWL
jgi:hypothetical protein